MKKSARLLILLLIVFACNKEQNVLDDINGSWKIKSFSLTDNEGIIYTFEFKLIYASKDYLKIEYWDESYRLNTLLYSR